MVSHKETLPIYAALFFENMPQLNTKSGTKHGGKRKNAGRKKKEPTKTIRVPLSKLAAVLATIGKD